MEDILICLAAQQTEKKDEDSGWTKLANQK